MPAVNFAYNCLSFARLLFPASPAHRARMTTSETMTMTALNWKRGTSGHSLHRRRRSGTTNAQTRRPLTRPPQKNCTHKINTYISETQKNPNEISVQMMKKRSNEISRLQLKECKSYRRCTRFCRLCNGDFGAIFVRITGECWLTVALVKHYIFAFSLALWLISQLWERFLIFDAFDVLKETSSLRSPGYFNIVSRFVIEKPNAKFTKIQCRR